jgi:hypothetical protein
MNIGPDFDGDVYEHEHDHARLTGQILRVFECIQDGAWRTLGEIAEVTGDPQSSISAQLRHLRKRRFGSYIVEKQARGERSRGLWEYRLLAPEPSTDCLPLECPV